MVAEVGSAFHKRIGYPLSAIIMASQMVGHRMEPAVQARLGALHARSGVRSRSSHTRSEVQIHTPPPTATRRAREEGRDNDSPFGAYAQRARNNAGRAVPAMNRIDLSMAPTA